MRLHVPVLGVLAVCSLAGVPATVVAESDPIDYNTARRDRKLAATRASGPIELDGQLNEPAWVTAPVAKGFIQNDPREGEPATFDTEVRLLYDDHAIYFGVFAHDDEPGEIIVNELRRTSTPATRDGFQIVIDTFDDERNGYQFAINPAGAKWDAQMSNEGRENNANWDGIWDVQTRIAEDGWYAEIRIPFRTLKFSARDHADLGHQLPAPAAPTEREQLLVAAAAHSPAVARVDGGTLEGLQGAAARREPARQAVRARQLEHVWRPATSTATSMPAST